MRTIRTASGQRAANTALRGAMEAKGIPTGQFVVSYPSGRSEVDGLYFKDVDLWVGISDLPGSRWWHGFNVGNPMAEPGPRPIAVEINIPMQATYKGIQGVALEDDRGHYWLGHRGRVGGNSASIGSGFLNWYPDGRAVVSDEGREIEVILIGKIEDPELPTLIRRFVDLAILYKAGGSIVQPTSRGSFRPEFTGEKSVDVRRNVYVASGVHGIVVQALHDQLARLGVSSCNDKHRDLYVESDDSMIACFEVKTSTSTTDCYTALGQLFLHGGKAKRRVFVAPSGTMKLEEAVVETGVEILRYRLDGGHVAFKGLKRFAAAIRD